jgi:hypothetical protein
MRSYKIGSALTWILFCAVVAAQNQPQNQGERNPAGQAQAGGNQGGRGGQAQIPPYEILSDHRVTFRIKAPQATIVELNGDWPGGPGGRTSVPMVKDDKGVWSVTVGPLLPDLNRIPDMAKLGALIPKLDARANMKLVYLAGGLNEPLVQSLKLVKKLLDERGAKYYATEQPGYTHETRFVRWGLRDFLPRRFQ